MRKIIFATKNRGKLKELQELISQNNLKIQLISLNDLDKEISIEENEDTFLGNALLKAKTIFEKFKIPVIADDSGLIVEALGDKPGVYSARYAGTNATDEENNNKLIKELKNISDRKAYFECALVFINEEGKVFTSQERCYGEIIDTPKGDKGFGYDPIFYIKEFNKTMAELDIKVKNQISHRGKAFKKLLKWLSNKED